MITLIPLIFFEKDNNYYKKNSKRRIKENNKNMVGATTSVLYQQHQHTVNIYSPWDKRHVVYQKLPTFTQK